VIAPSGASSKGAEAVLGRALLAGSFCGRVAARLLEPEAAKDDVIMEAGRLASESGHDRAVRCYLDDTAIPQRHPNVAIGVDAEAVSVLPDARPRPGDRIVAQQRAANGPQDAIPIDESAIAATADIRASNESRMLPLAPSSL